MKIIPCVWRSELFSFDIGNNMKMHRLFLSVTMKENTCFVKEIVTKKLFGQFFRVICNQNSKNNNMRIQTLLTSIF